MPSGVETYASMIGMNLPSFDELIQNIALVQRPVEQEPMATSEREAQDRLFHSWGLPVPLGTGDMANRREMIHLWRAILSEQNAGRVSPNDRVQLYDHWRGFCNERLTGAYRNREYRNWLTMAQGIARRSGAVPYPSQRVTDEDVQRMMDGHRTVVPWELSEERAAFLRGTTGVAATRSNIQEARNMPRRIPELGFEKAIAACLKHEKEEQKVIAITGLWKQFSETQDYVRVRFLFNDIHPTQAVIYNFRLKKTKSYPISDATRMNRGWFRETCAQMEVLAKEWGRPPA